MGMEGRKTRTRRVPTSTIKPSFVKPPASCHPVLDKLSKSIAGADCGLSEPSEVVTPLYMLMDRKDAIPLILA